MSSFIDDVLNDQPKLNMMLHNQKYSKPFDVFTNKLRLQQEKKQQQTQQQQQKYKDISMVDKELDLPLFDMVENKIDENKENLLKDNNEEQKNNSNIFHPLFNNYNIMKDDK